MLKCTRIFIIGEILIHDYNIKGTLVVDYIILSALNVVECVLEFEGDIF